MHPRPGIVGRRDARQVGPVLGQKAFGIASEPARGEDDGAIEILSLTIGDKFDASDFARLCAQEPRHLTPGLELEVGERLQLLQQRKDDGGAGGRLAGASMGAGKAVAAELRHDAEVDADVVHEEVDGGGRPVRQQRDKGLAVPAGAGVSGGGQPRAGGADGVGVEGGILALLEAGRGAVDAGGGLDAVAAGLGGPLEQADRGAGAQGLVGGGQAGEPRAHDDDDGRGGGGGGLGHWYGGGGSQGEEEAAGSHEHTVIQHGSQWNQNGEEYGEQDAPSAH